MVWDTRIFVRPVEMVLANSFQSRDWPQEAVAGEWEIKGLHGEEREVVPA